MHFLVIFFLCYVVGLAQGILIMLRAGPTPSQTERLFNRGYEQAKKDIEAERSRNIPGA